MHYMGVLGQKLSRYSECGVNMVAKKKADLEALVLGLLKEKKEISVPDVAQAAGMLKSDEGDRKAIRRVLTTLVERGVLEARGAARARVYAALTTTTPAAAEAPKPQEGLKSFKAFQPPI